MKFFMCYYKKKCFIELFYRKYDQRGNLYGRMKFLKQANYTGYGKINS